MSLEPFLYDDPKRIYGTEEKRRLDTAKERLLKVLLDGEWHTNLELSKITHRFSARLYDLRREGWIIERIHLDRGIWAYRLAGRTINRG